MANNYVLLDRIELNATAASVTFDNIPQTGYTDLKVVSSVRDSSSNNLCSMYFNGDTNSANYTNNYILGNGSSVSGGTNSSWLVAGIQEPSGNTANTFASGEFYVPNYTSSNQKSVSVDGVQENNATGAWAWMNASKWSGTAAITSVTLAGIGASFVSGSTFSLYGVAKLGTTPAIAPKANGGNVIGTDGTYWYHAFLSSGTFTPQVGLTADVLVVAGGGAGDDYGGGGAGGLRNATLALTTSSLAVAVGAGGSASNGSNSVFSSITSTGGGWGASSGDTRAGGNGGSGGGGGIGQAPGSGNTPSTSPSQGNNGGTAVNFPNYGGGGGGGAGAVGTNGTGSAGGAGGVGSSAYSSWGLATVTGQNVSGTVYYAGGGGGGGWLGAGSTTLGGVGGLGGGGKGQGKNDTASVAGTPNTGGGGGGSGQGGAGGVNGGSGIVIIRYLVA